MKTRAQILDLATRREYDLVVIGGGIVGAGIAQDAAYRGLSVLLIDKDDFAAGTSSRTTKLIHGGLRYLEQWQFQLTRQLCQERALLQQLAPHLIKDFSFVLPLLQGHDFFAWKAQLGLFIYDHLADYDLHVVMQSYEKLNQKQFYQTVPSFNNPAIVGGLKFHDAITDDARLVLEVIKSACGSGAHALNYLQANAFDISDGAVHTVHCHDRYSGTELSIHCKAVINATGVWSDTVAQMIDPAWSAHVLPAKGIHITLPLSALDTHTALILPTKDKRYVFVLPWQRALIVGTTDSAYEGALENPQPSADEIDYLLASLNSYLPQRQLNRSDVIASWAGLRPLVGHEALKALGQKNGVSNKTSQISREHQIVEGPGGMITVVGGKLTNYRLIANQVLDRLLNKFPALAKPGTRVTRTNRIMLGGFFDKPDYLTTTAALSTKARRLGVEPATIEHLLSTYGKDTENVLALVESQPALNQRICPDFPPIYAEVLFSILNEMALSLEDIMLRRLRLGVLNEKQSLEAAPNVAKLAQALLGWDEVRVAAELSALETALGARALIYAN